MLKALFLIFGTFGITNVIGRKSEKFNISRKLKYPRNGMMELWKNVEREFWECKVWSKSPKIAFLVK